MNTGNNRSRVLRGLLLMGGAMAMAACSNDTMQISDKPLFVLHSSSQCATPTTEPSATWLNNHAAVADFYARLDHQQIGLERRLPAIDFDEAGVLLIEMGRRTTGGYALALAEPSIELDGKTASITLNWQEPVPGSIVTQALSSPCLLIQVPRGEYTMIHLLDQSGKLRLKVATSS